MGRHYEALLNIQKSSNFPITSIHKKLPVKLEEELSQAALTEIFNLYVTKSKVMPMRHRIEFLSYWTKALTPAEKAYATHDKECLSVLRCLEDHRNVLNYHRTSSILTDSSPALYLLNALTHRNKFSKINRWSLQFYAFTQKYKIMLCHISGGLNGAADALSRIFIAEDYFTDKLQFTPEGSELAEIL